jgi:antitoxin (DNA-binding transcriptional repressor) of toxin-antitoxin stability system
MGSGVRAVRKLEISEAGHLSEYGRNGEETWALTRKGKPVAAVVPIDSETVALGSNPDFLHMIEDSRARYRAEGGISLEEMKLKLGIEAAKPARRRKTVTRKAS